MNEIVMKVLCDEPEGPVMRAVKFAPLTIESLRHYKEKLSKFPTLFNRFVTDDVEFFSSFISMDENGKMKSNGLLWEVDDVGIIYLTDIYPEYQGTAHFTFWDQRFRGREELVRRMLRYGFEEYGFQRIICEVPLYTQPTMGAVERVGFVNEGRLRKATWYKGEWWDVNLYSVLREEVLKNG